MAQFIPVNGPLGSEESFTKVWFRQPRCFPDGCLISHDRLKTGRTLLSRLDVTIVNPVATELAGGKTIYGDAILYYEQEQMAD